MLDSLKSIFVQSSTIPREWISLSAPPVLLKLSFSSYVSFKCDKLNSFPSCTVLGSSGWPRGGFTRAGETKGGGGDWRLLKRKFWIYLSDPVLQLVPHSVLLSYGTVPKSRDCCTCDSNRLYLTNTLGALRKPVTVCMI